MHTLPHKVSLKLLISHFLPVILTRLHTGTLDRKCVRHNTLDFYNVAQAVKTNRWGQLAAILRKYVEISSTASSEITFG